MPQEEMTALQQLALKIELVDTELGRMRDLCIQVMREQVAGASGAPTPDFRWDAPVGTPEERVSAKLWPGGWFDATGYNVKYTSSTGILAFHTGADLNNNSPAPYSDVRAPVYAPADGVVKFAGRAQGWQGKMVIVKVVLEDGSCRWPRLAHLGDTTVLAGRTVKRGDLLGHIGDYTPAGSAGDHLHYDIARKDLGASPIDWPGLDQVRVTQDYENPLEFTRSHG